MSPLESSGSETVLAPTSVYTRALDLLSAMAIDIWCMDMCVDMRPTATFLRTPSHVQMVCACLCIDVRVGMVTGICTGAETHAEGGPDLSRPAARHRPRVHARARAHAHAREPGSSRRPSARHRLALGLLGSPRLLFGPSRAAPPPPHQRHAPLRAQARQHEGLPP